MFFTTSHSRGDRWRGVLTVKGKRHFVYAKTQDACWEKLSRLRESQERVTVETWLNRWLDGLHKRDTTARAYRDAVERIVPSLRGIMLSDLRSVDVQRALDTMRRTEAERNGYQPPTADVLTHPAKEIFGRAWGKGRINLRLRPGVVKPRDDENTIAITSHDPSIGWAERTNNKRG